METRLLSLKAAAQLAGCSTTTIRRMAKQDVLALVEIRKKWFVTRSSLAAWLASQPSTCPICEPPERARK